MPRARVPLRVAVRDSAARIVVLSLKIASTENKAKEKVFFPQECCLAKIASNMYEYMYMYLGNYRNESFLVMKFVMNAFHSH